MNKKGEFLMEGETIEWVILLALGIVLLLFLVKLVNIEKHNGLRAEDLALTINSIYVPSGTVSLEYEMGFGKREIIFEEGMVGTFIKDPIRRRDGLILHDRNYLFRGEDTRTEFLEMRKEGNRVDVV